MRDIALDVHIDFVGVAIAEGGEIRSAGRIATRPEELELFAQSLDPADRVALEVTGNAWAIRRIIEPHVSEVIVVCPTDTGIRGARAKTDRLDSRTLARLLAAIASARVKTDAVDARTLAQLLRADLLPEAYIAPRELRDLRDLLRQRFVLTQMRTALKNRVHALIARHGIQHGHSKLLGRGGRAFLVELELRPEPRARLDVQLRLISDFDREIDALAAELDRLAKHDDRVTVLCQIRGIGRYLGMLIVAEIGDIARFPRPASCAPGPA